MEITLSRKINRSGSYFTKSTLTSSQSPKGSIMPDIDVHLRIVGLFFSETVEIDNTERLSIKNVLDTYITGKPVSEPDRLA